MVNRILAPDRRALDEEARARPPRHHPPAGFSDRFALGFTKLLRFCADAFFAKRYGHRAIVLETGSRSSPQFAAVSDLNESSARVG